MARKRSASRKHTGELATPIYEPLLASSDTTTKAKARRHVKEKLKEKLKLLFTFHGIDINADEKRMELNEKWMGLAVKLAFEHVPGIKVIPDRPPKRGRKRKWDTLGYDLLDDVDVVRKSKGCSILEAIKILILTIFGSH